MVFFMKIDYKDDFNEIINQFEHEISEKNNLIKKYENIIEIHNYEIDYKNSQMMSIKSQLDLKNSKTEQLEYKLLNKENNIKNTQNEIISLKSEIKQKQKDFLIKEANLKNQVNNNLKKINEQKLIIDNKNQEIENKNVEIEVKENELKENKNELLHFKKLYGKETEKLAFYEEEILSKNLEIEYLTKKPIQIILNPLSYMALILKSNPKEILINIKLFQALKKSKQFDVGFYLRKNKDIQKSKWAKYFSPELHYVCRGFSEKRKFNNSQFNLNSKKELFENLSNNEDI